jgi:uncharacterized 2Fe-2S/4Fe-4S cluster protein (DUF4445 family)
VEAGGRVEACRVVALSDTVVENLSAHLSRPFISMQAPSAPVEPIGAAVDIGTTTVKAALVGLESGETHIQASMMNPQGVYGSDVLVRLEAAGSSGGGRRLRDLIVGGIRGLLNRMCRTQGVVLENITGCVLVGNTPMTVIFQGIDPTGLALAPHRSPIEGSGRVEVDAKALGLDAAAPFFPPVLGGFVGSDITAGLLVAGFGRNGGVRIFIDVGTNGEIVLKTEDRILTASAAAGPALEGGHLSMGMPAVPGAVHAVREAPSGDLDLDVIGNEEPRGFCGSGIMELLSIMARTGVMDLSGQLNSDQPGVEIRSGQAVFTPVDRFPGLVVTQGDVRAVQLASGALRTGMDILLNEVGLRAGELDEIVLTGAFGANLEKRAAETLGLVPSGGVPVRILEDCALKGAIECLLDPQAAGLAETLAGKVEHVVLAERGFEERFLKSLDFPDYE